MLFGKFHFKFILSSGSEVVTIETHQNDIMWSMGLQLIREMGSIHRWNDEESWIIFRFTAYNTFVFSLGNIKLIIFIFFSCFPIKLSVAWFEIELDRQRFFYHNSCQTLIYVPLGLLVITITQAHSIWRQQFTIFIYSLFTGVGLDNILPSLILFSAPCSMRVTFRSTFSIVQIVCLYPLCNGFSILLISFHRFFCNFFEVTFFNLTHGSIDFSAGWFDGNLV